MGPEKLECVEEAVRQTVNNLVELGSQSQLFYLRGERQQNWIRCLYAQRAEHLIGEIQQQASFGSWVF